MAAFVDFADWSSLSSGAIYFDPVKLEHIALLTCLEANTVVGQVFRTSVSPFLNHGTRL